jgi:hypothetical protein
MSLVRLSLAGRTGESSRSSTASVAARLLAAGGRQRRSLAASTPRDSSGAAPAASSSSSSSSSSNNSAASSSDATGSAYVVSERPSIAAQRLAVSTRERLTRELPVAYLLLTLAVLGTTPVNSSTVPLASHLLGCLRRLCCTPFSSQSWSVRLKPTPQAAGGIL